MGRINVFRTKEIKEAIAASPDKAQEIIDNENEYEIVRFWEVVKKDGNALKFRQPQPSLTTLWGPTARDEKSPLLIIKTKTRRTHNLNCRLTGKAPCKARGFSI